TGPGAAIEHGPELGGRHHRQGLYRAAQGSIRILHEKRKAADAIELLKLIAKQPIVRNEADTIGCEYENEDDDDANSHQLRSFLTATVRPGPIVNQPQRTDTTAAAAEESSTLPSTTIVSLPAVGTVGNYSDGKHNITVHLQPTVGSEGEDTLDTTTCLAKPTDSNPDHSSKPI
ncbi:AGAP010585-PA, partial [Anopheles gambiae str. PEST]